MPIVDLAVALEERGFSGIFLNEHPHMPVEQARSQYPPGGEIPDRYARFWDPYVALSFVAARTGLEIGTCISLVAGHDPIALAKAPATLDVLSGGRLVFGVGFGWHREEFEDHGGPARVRAAVVEETVALVKSLWTEEVATFAGERLRLSRRADRGPSRPKRPHPPVLLGARHCARAGARSLERARELGVERVLVGADVRTDLGLGRQLDPPWRVTRRRRLARPPATRPARRLRSGAP